MLKKDHEGVNITNTKLDKGKISKYDVLTLFHHIHYEKKKLHQENKKYSIHHCGRSHLSVNPKLDYTIKHCKCNKHRIDKKEAYGHDLESNEVLVKFKEACPEGGWHVESGIIIINKKSLKF